MTQPGLIRLLCSLVLLPVLPGVTGHTVPQIGVARRARGQHLLPAGVALAVDRRYGPVRCAVADQLEAVGTRAAGQIEGRWSVGGP